MTTYDLSHGLGPGTSVYPDDPPVELERYARIEADGYRATALRLSTHAGTHVDAPAHTEPGGRTVDEYPPEAFRFDAAKLDLGDAAAREPITREDLRTATADVGLDGASAAEMVVLRTDWDARWGEAAYHDHPFLAPEAAEWLAEAGCHVGVDALSVDPTPSAKAGRDEPEGVSAHRAILGADRFVVENLTGLDAVPARFTLEAYPLAVADGDGAPARVIGRDD